MEDDSRQREGQNEQRNAQNMLMDWLHWYCCVSINISFVLELLVFCISISFKLPANISYCARHRTV